MLLDIGVIEEKIGYKFQNPQLLMQAFTRKTYALENNLKGCHNEILEFLGDAVLNCAVTDLIIEKYGVIKDGLLSASGSEGDFTRIKSNFSRKESLAAVISGLGLSEFFLLGKGDRLQGVSEQDSAKEDLFESILGAVFLDSGRDYAVAKSVAARLLKFEQKYSQKGEKDAKSALQERCAQSGYSAPVYTEKSACGPAHNITYVIELKVKCGGAEICAEGEGRSKQLAEMRAAQKAMQQMKSRNL